MKILLSCLDAGFLECLKERSFLLGLCADNVGIGADKSATRYGILNNIFKVHFALMKISRTVVHVLRVDEYANALVRVLKHRWGAG